jgi:hypothetical protein
MAAAMNPENLRISAQRQGANRRPDKRPYHWKTPWKNRPQITQNAANRTIPMANRTDIAAALRANQAMQLIIAGNTYDEAARQCGYSGRPACFTAVQRELKLQVQPASDELRRLEILRLDQMLVPFLAKALTGDEFAADRVLGIMARRAKLLGLDITRDELMAAMPYQKRIVLEDSPAQPLLGEGAP